MPIIRLRGQRFKLVTYRHNWGEDRVYFHDSSRVLRSIPACWTTVAARRPVRADWPPDGACFAMRIC